MTGTRGSGREWWTRPSVVLPCVAAVAFIVALLSPQASSGRFGDARLSSHATGSLGARVLHDLAVRLGWMVVREDTVTAPRGADGVTIHALLAPVVPVTPAEAHRYLEAVRAGDGLLFVLEGRTPLADSLGVQVFPRGGLLPVGSAAHVQCGRRFEIAPSIWPDGRVHLNGLRWMRSAPSDRVTFATLGPDELGQLPPGDAAVGFPYGRGRVVVVADPDLLRNDVLRYCRWGTDVIAVKMLEWLRAGGEAPRVTLAFDEYHQGYGGRSSALGVTAGFLVGHPLGRAILVCVLAALVLLLAEAPRPIVPADVQRVERRDPLEQVDALAHAYEQVRATRTATALLLRGLRWRVERGGAAARARTDDQFLDAATSRAPALATDAGVVRRALNDALPERDLPAVGAALRHIEDTLTTSPT
ncbi:MAG: DUF4350 domain-containing protein [bacterium]